MWALKQLVTATFLSHSQNRVQAQVPSHTSFPASQPRYRTYFPTLPQERTKSVNACESNPLVPPPFISAPVSMPIPTISRAPVLTISADSSGISIVTPKGTVLQSIPPPPPENHFFDHKKPAIVENSSVSHGTHAISRENGVKARAHGNSAVSTTLDTPKGQSRCANNKIPFEPAVHTFSGTQDPGNSNTAEKTDIFEQISISKTESSIASPQSTQQLFVQSDVYSPLPSDISTFIPDSEQSLKAHFPDDETPIKHKKRRRNTEPESDEFLYLAADFTSDFSEDDFSECHDRDASGDFTLETTELPSDDSDYSANPNHKSKKPNKKRIMHKHKNAAFTPGLKPNGDIVTVSTKRIAQVES